MIVKDKVEHVTTFAPHDFIAKTEHTEDLKRLLAQEIQEPRAMKMKNFKKRCNHALAVKVNPTIE